jgi:mono/diheme cytochrome c family protein
MALMMFSGMLLFTFALFADQTSDPAINYQVQVRHVFQERCFACHGALKQEGGLRVDTAAAAIKGGDGGPAIVPGKDSESMLLTRISATDIAERMPPEGEPLKPEEISAIRLWIQQGAKAPLDEEPESDPRDHWSFKTPVRPEVPAVTNSAWVLNPVDAFIAKTHDVHGLTPQPTAERLVWLRRVSLDLTGLPPTRTEQTEFLNDTSPDAFDTVVTRLLDSPQYGERWGRHWMDIWRYSDWWGLGAEVRNSQKHIWHWRDWIVESLNEDKAYDQMLREMLAADELYPNDLNKLRATGFLARQYFKFNRTSWLDETVEHTSKAMLGLTFNCSKCHDHKYDPVSQVEYYQMRAFFEPYQVRTDAVPGELDFEKNGIPRAFDCNPDAPTYVHVRGDDRNPDKERLIHPELPQFLNIGEFRIQPVNLPAEAFQPGLRQHVIEAHLRTAESQIAAAKAALDDAKKKLTLSQKKAADTVAAPADPADDSDEKPKALVTEDFATEQPAVWEFKSGDWKYQDGKLVQSQVGSTRAAIRLKQNPPTDFQATLKYVPTGGNMWKSVGIRFDAADDESDVMVYMSSYAGGPKAQVSYQTQGSQVYPAEGASTRAVQLNQPHELTIRVRGTLINAVVDGQQAIAYQLPVARRAGFLELITFDAKAEFLSFSMSTLPGSVTLVKPAGAKPSDAILSPEQAQLVVTIAEHALRKAEAAPASILARSAAERARLEAPEAAETKGLIAAAVRAERVVAAANAAEELAKAELAVLQAAADKKAEAEKGLAAAKTALDASQKAIETPGEEFTPITGALKTLENNLETEASRRKPFPATSTGRRTALARWITDPRHPLPARVAVNHIWARHFGKGLVPTVFDFGRKGTPPTHPELLDWLAVEFVEHGWSMKHLHRLIVLSNTYRMTSSAANAHEQNLVSDRDNIFLWRRNPIRMEAQIVRDSLLNLAGELDLTTGGPSVPVKDDQSRRRSLYYVHSHNEHQKFLSIFDDANVLECYRRSESIVPQQALALENSSLASDMAKKISAKVESSLSEPSETAFVREAFLTVLGVEPTGPEVAASIDAISQLTAAATSAGRPAPHQQARAGLVLALLNHNDFVTVR